MVRLVSLPTLIRRWEIASAVRNPLLGTKETLAVVFNVFAVFIYRIGFRPDIGERDSDARSRRNAQRAGTSERRSIKRRGGGSISRA
jgi:hypothetical protein